LSLRCLCSLQCLRKTAIKMFKSLQKTSVKFQGLFHFLDSHFFMFAPPLHYDQDVKFVPLANLYYIFLYTPTPTPLPTLSMSITQFTPKMKEEGIT
jgi:hypothetical protein